MKDLRIGVIGAGGRGALSRLAHKPGEGSRLAAAADTNEESLAQFRSDYGDDVFITTDYRELITRDDVDACFICTPDFLHEEMAVNALEAGMPIYLEKPIATTIEGCDRILNAAMGNKTRLYVGHNMRHFPMILKMKEVIDSGAIGEVQAAWCRHFVSYGGDAYFKDWHSERRYVTSLLLQKGAHDIDVLHWLCGGYTRRTVGMGKLSVYNRCEDRRDPDEPGKAGFDSSNWPPLSQKKVSPKIDVEDHNMVMMELDNGVQVSYMQCHYTPDAWRNYTIIGTEGRIENRGDVGRCRVEVTNVRYDGFEDPDTIHQLKPDEGGHGGGDPRIVEEFLAFLRGDVDVTNTSPVAARNAVAVGVKGAESIRSGNVPYDIPPLAPGVREYFDGGQPGSSNA